jgi:hypothetical protein
MNIVAQVERRDRMAWESDTNGWGYISESSRLGYELGRLVSAVYDEPGMWEEYKSSYSGLPDLVKLADIYGITVEVGDTWIRFGPSGKRAILMTVNFTKCGDAFDWKATVEKV